MKKIKHKKYEHKITVPENYVPKKVTGNFFKIRKIQNIFNNL